MHYGSKQVRQQWFKTGEAAIHYGSEQVTQQCTLVQNRWGSNALWFRKNEAAMHYGLEQMRHQCIMVQNRQGGKKGKLVLNSLSLGYQIIHFTTSLEVSEWGNKRAQQSVHWSEHWRAYKWVSSMTMSERTNWWAIDLVITSRFLVVPNKRAMPRQSTDLALNLQKSYSISSFK